MFEWRKLSGVILLISVFGSYVIHHVSVSPWSVAGVQVTSSGEWDLGVHVWFALSILVIVYYWHNRKTETGLFFSKSWKPMILGVVDISELYPTGLRKEVLAAVSPGAGQCCTAMLSNYLLV